jgi:hypothetical protein
VFCEGVYHRLRFCLDHLSCVKMAVFQFHLQSGKQRKIGWVGTTVMLFLVKKIPWWKMKCDRVRCRDAVASSFVVAKVRSEVFSHFHAVVVIRHSSMRNRLFGLPGRILCEQSPWWQRQLWACSWLFSSCSVLVSLGFPRLILCSLNTWLIISRFSVALFRDLHQIWCSSFFGSIAKSHIRSQIKGRKKSAHKLSCVKFCALISIDMPVLSSTVASRYYKCCIWLCSIYIGKYWCVLITVRSAQKISLLFTHRHNEWENCWQLEI